MRGNSQPSTVDWCEQNYVYSNYIAEFWNTLSSFILAYAGYVGYVRNRPYKGSFVFVVLLVVGLGSVLFHANLTASSQMYDEIPMIFLLQWLSINSFNVTSIVGVVFSYTIAIAVSSVVVFTAFLKEHEIPELENHDGEHHHHAYGPIKGLSRIEFYLFQSIVIMAACYLFRLLLTKAVKKNHTRKIFTRGCVVFLMGWSCWLCDYFLCSFLREHGNPQLHAWWHLGSAIGVYQLCIVSIMLRNPDMDVRVAQEGWELKISGKLGRFGRVKLPVLFTTLTRDKQF